jgi:hypothetical protein
MQSENINELMGALAKAQGEMCNAIKDSANPFFKSKYADLSSVWNACRGPLSKNGLAIVQTIQQRESGEVLHTLLGHASGQWMSSTMPIKVKSDNKSANEIQQLGSCLTYLRRYSLSAIVGIAPDDDDDGNTATAYQNKPKAATEPESNIITGQQAHDLNDIVSRCSPGFKQFVIEFLRKGKISGLSTLPKEAYGGLYKQAVEDEKVYQADMAVMA